MTAPMPKGLADRVLEEVAARKRLDQVIGCLVEPGDDHVFVTTLRRLLRMCGLNPTTTYLTEVVTRMGSYFHEMRIKGPQRRAMVLPGLKLVEGGLEKARKKLAHEWMVTLSKEGLSADQGAPPIWHRISAEQAGTSLLRRKDGSSRLPPGTLATCSKMTVRLSDDWRDGNPDPSVVDRVFTTCARREAMGVYNSRVQDYLWEQCDWRQFPAIHRMVWELHVVDGLSPLEIARKLGRHYSGIKVIFQRHRALAGVVPRGRQLKK